MTKRHLHELEIRPLPMHGTKVHARAFACAVETVALFDGVTHQEAALVVIAELESGALRLVVTGSHAAYCYA